ncbi:hypothetical protein [Streptomyces sp. NPDC018031]|uniref:hypothetical protein n=1 Tax=Streptomyces sp. NPDC018031 TaxID=3365033 RepID=UPI0037A99900
MARSGRSRIAALSVAGVLAGTVVVGCGGDGDTAGPADESRATKGADDARNQATEAVRSAYDRTADQETARVTLRTRTSAEGKSATVRGKGAVDLDDGDSVLTLTADGGRIEQRVVDQLLYQKPPAGQAPDGKPWIRIDLRKVAAQQRSGDQSMNDPARSASLAKAIDDKDVVKSGTATVGGVTTTRYRVRVDVAELPDGAALSKRLGPTLPMDLWLDDQGRIRRQQVDMALKATPRPEAGSSQRSSSAPQGVTVRTVLEFSDFGTEVEADAPPASQVTDLTDEAVKQDGAAR